MGFSLAPGISYAETAGRRIFLDLRRDRYFCLGEAADAAFAARVGSGPLSPHHTNALQALAAANILVDDPLGECPRPCRTMTLTGSALDADPQPKASMLRVVPAASAIQRAKRHVRTRPLAQVCARLAAARNRVSERTDRDLNQGVSDLAASYAAAGRIVTTLNHCLPVAVAMMRQCIRSGIPARLTMDIKIQPFEAHAWVSVGKLVISDRFDTVRPFTPILIL